MAFGLTMTHLTGLSRLVGYPQFWVLAAMIVLGDIWPIVTPGRSNAEAPVASVTFGLGALFACGLPAALLLRAVSCFVVCVAERKSLHRAAFNAAAVTLSTVAAWAVLYAVDIRPTAAQAKIDPHVTNLQWLLLAGLVCFAGALPDHRDGRQHARQGAAPADDPPDVRLSSSSSTAA